MKRLVALLFAVLVVAALATSVLADDPLADLSGLAQQEQANPHLQGGSAATTMGDIATVPTSAEVQAEIDALAGETEQDRIAAYTAQLQSQLTAHPQDVQTLARLGTALALGGDMARARTYLEQAISLEPGAQSLYDSLASAISQADPGIKVYVEGKAVSFDVQPLIRGGRTLVPIRKVAEALGAQVSWDAGTATATVLLGTQVVLVTKDSTTARVNGQVVTLDVPATIVDGRTLLPLRFVSESLGKKVDWHPGAAGSAVISIVDP